MRNKYITIVTEDGTRLKVLDVTHMPSPKPTTKLKLPDPREAAREGGGPTDRSTSAAWLYGENGKAPR